MITEGQHGHLVDSGALEQLRAAITRLWNDREAQGRMGREARKLVETRFSQETRTRSLLDIYHRLQESASRRLAG
jgi:glycosyltransferase involved in cell wall biosynthesis